VWRFKGHSSRSIIDISNIASTRKKPRISLGLFLWI
jgi:hypothetical protein